MRTYFLADTHWQHDNLPLCQALSQVLHAIAADPELSALYVLGDVFELWLGDGSDDHTFLQQLSALPVPVYVQQGNRDFLLNHKALNPFGLTLLPERWVLVLGGQRVLLEHGDLLCVDDVGYQRLRKVLRSPWVQRLFYALPTRWRQALAQRLRGQSNGKKTWVDVNDAEVERVMQAYDVEVLVHGHVHRAGAHQQRAGKRFVLGDFRPNAHGHYHGVLLVHDDKTQSWTMWDSAEHQKAL